MTTPSEILSRPLTLPNGAVLPNRILKSAMSEILGTRSHAPSKALPTLYRRWAQGGTGLLITGNVMIDRRRLGEPGNVVVEDERDLEALRDWAAAGTEGGVQLWMQLNHPGKQSPKFLPGETVAPSAVGFGPQLSSAFAVPRALEHDEILDIIERFGCSAAVAKKAGFTGVQIHGAHGYLVSQFLSPHHNRREDGWGGSLENRSRFVREVYKSIRNAVGPAFPIGIKLNSADFQKGGMNEEDSLQVMKELESAGIDMIEVSGGTYEAPAMTGFKSKETREGYFLAFVERAREELKVPLCVTGGFRSPEGMSRAVHEGAADLVGLATTLAIQPDFSRDVLAGKDVRSKVRKLSTGIKALDRLAMLDVTWYETQLWDMASGKEPKPSRWPITSFFLTVSRTGMQAFRSRRARKSLAKKKAREVLPANSEN